MQQCQCRAKQRCQAECQWHTGMAVDMNADVDPGNTAAKHAQTVKPAAPQALAGAAGTQQIGVHDTTENARGPDIEGRQRQCDQGAGQKCPQQHKRGTEAGFGTHGRALLDRR